MSRWRTFLVLGQTEVAIPALYKDHIIRQVLALDLQLLHNYNIGLQYIEHGIECAIRAPWLVPKRVANAVDIPCGDANHGGMCGSNLRRTTTGMYISKLLHRPAPSSMPQQMKLFA